MKKILSLLLLISFISFDSEAAIPVGTTTGSSAGAASSSTAGSDLQDTYDSYSKFDYGDSMNWGDCFDFDLGIGVDMCPGGFIYPPYPTATLEYSYYDVVAMVEVVHDPWRSFLYDESFYDFTSEAESGLASDLGVTPGIGTGYGNSGSGSSKEFSGQQKLETHVWAVSDWWRLKTSDKALSCLSLTCKNEDYTGCIMSIKNTMSSMDSDFGSMVGSINSNESAEGKGQGVQNSETGEVAYEDGSVYEKQETTNDRGQVTSTRYVQTRPPGNYGYGNMGASAGASMNFSNAESPVPGMDGANAFQTGMQAVQDSSVGLVSSVSSLATDAWNGSDTKAQEDAQNSEGSSDSGSVNPKYVQAAGSSGGLPASTKGGGSMPSQRSSSQQSDFGGQDLSQSASTMSSNTFGSNDPGKQSAAGNVMNQTGAAGQDMGSDAMEQAMAIIDRIQYFSVIEQIIQMIATVSPVMVHPVYMSERHDEAAAEGGFILSGLYSSFAEMGAGMIMPIFCMSKSAGMAVDGVANLVGFDISSGFLGPISSFINSRCVGSWGPLEPRVTLLGTGDHLVAAGLAAVRGLDIAQNITGDMYNKTINNTPFNELRFNLDWPHTSDCYGFQGFEGLSRGWTTPINSASIDNIINSASNGDGAGMADQIGSGTVGNVTKQGGYIFTFWRKRKCRYLLSCDIWRGDTGL